MSENDTRDVWHVVGERYEPDLVAQEEREIHQVMGHDEDEPTGAWVDIPGLVTIITEHKYRVDPSELIIGLVDTRTRLVVRGESDAAGNGHPHGFEPLTVDTVRYPTEYPGIRFVRRMDSDHEMRDESLDAPRAVTDEETSIRIRFGLLQDFMAERLQRTTVDTAYVRLPVAFASYTSWCDERRVTSVDRYTYPLFVAEVRRAWKTVSDEPITLPSGDYEYVITRTALIGG